MNLQANTVLITGGTSGIGKELARQLLALGNTVIVTGRDEGRLLAAGERLGGVHALRCDVDDPASVRELHARAVAEHPGINMLINCAGIMRKIDLQRVGDDLEDLTREVRTNLNGTMWMNAVFVPHLLRQPNAAIVNVSSGLAFIPMPIAPVYSASKAAVHAYTVALRLQLKNTGVKVFELAAPGTDTPLFHGDFDEDDTRGVRPMAVQPMVVRALAGLRRDELEIRPGMANVLKLFSRLSPGFVLKRMERQVALMQARAQR